MRSSPNDTLRVLVVDDDPNMVATLRDILEAGDFLVDVAYSGSEAIEKAADRAPDCVLMDLRMPGLDGVETFRRLKKSSPECCVIFMTAYAASELVAEAKEEGAVEVMPKPLDLKKVLGLLEAGAGRPSILVVGDPHGSKDALGKYLVEDDLHIRYARNVDEAVLQLAHGSWCAVIVDMEYGGRIGVDGLRVIRDLDPQASMILVSGVKGRDDEAQKQLKTIATSYFTRAFTVDDLAARVRQVSIRRHMQRALDLTQLAIREVGGEAG